MIGPLDKKQLEWGMQTVCHLLQQFKSLVLTRGEWMWGTSQDIHSALAHDFWFWFKEIPGIIQTSELAVGPIFFYCVSGRVWKRYGVSWNKQNTQMKIFLGLCWGWSFAGFPQKHLLLHFIVTSNVRAVGVDGQVCSINCKKKMLFRCMLEDFSFVYITS